MYTGGCLCNSIRFEVDEIVGPFELCHCRRCRKSSGSSHAAMVGVSASGYKITKGKAFIKTITLDIIEKPPAYSHSFCAACGSPVTLPSPDEDWLEVPAGSFDTALPVSPDKHIFIEMKPAWDQVSDTLPTYTKAQLKALRDLGEIKNQDS